MHKTTPEASRKVPKMCFQVDSCINLTQFSLLEKPFCSPDFERCQEPPVLLKSYCSCLAYLETRAITCFLPSPLIPKNTFLHLSPESIKTSVFATYVWVLPIIVMSIGATPDFSLVTLKQSSKILERASHTESIDSF